MRFLPGDHNATSLDQGSGPVWMGYQDMHGDSSVAETETATEMKRWDQFSNSLPYLDSWRAGKANRLCPPFVREEGAKRDKTKQLAKLSMQRFLAVSCLQLPGV
jgi:hypothetical protein